MNDRATKLQTAPNRLPWPPILYGLAIIAGYLLFRVEPVPWPGGMAGEWLFMAGLIIIGGALFLDVRTFLELRKHKTTILPHRGASHLVTTGPFSFSRNPIYLSNTLLMFGLAMVFANAWFALTGLAAAFATNTLAIRREEKHLELKFGSHWRQYAKRVRRWI